LHWALESSMPSIEHLQSLTLDLPPCCVEFWPLDVQYAVVGTYNLEKTEETQDGVEGTENVGMGEGKKTQQRNGSLILVKVDGNEV
jgi:diphthamide biosynthesis protein 7